MIEINKKEKKQDSTDSQPSSADSKPRSGKLKEDFIRRVKDNKTTRWIRFGIVSVIFFLWVAWVGNWWLALAFLLLFDIYITGYIPFTWWKKSKNNTVRSIMSWVDAIVYALVLVYFIFAFIGQNYMIPTPSLEKTLMTGDYLWVNKAMYGPRVPMTPIHFPLVHNKLPILNCKSYLDWPTNDYHRLKGLRDVEMGDIVVFNFPAGDTVALNTENPDPRYASIRAMTYEQLVDHYGWKRVNTDKDLFGEIVYRPVDRRENYVKRCVGLPGDNFKIKNDTIYINGVAQPYPEHIQFNRIVALSSPLTDEMAKELNITPSEVQLVNQYDANQQPVYQAFSQILGAPQNAYIYVMPVTQGMLDKFAEAGILEGSVKYKSVYEPARARGAMYPKGIGNDWTLSDWGGDSGVTIPKKGMTVKLNQAAWDLYGRCIRNYEGHPEAYFADGKAYIDGKVADTYTFGMDYYFMMGDNRDNSLDSRFWGFVPEDHIVGTPMFVIGSYDGERGRVRTDRFFIDANPDK